ncbi:MAG TPA: heparinase II/III family protein [Gemmatirosa sp.]
MLAVRRWPAAAGTLARTFGVRGAALRAAHELRRTTHRFRADVRYAVTSAPPPDGTFRVDAARLRAATDLAVAVARGDRVVAGEHEAYRWTWTALPATADAWLRHPATEHVHRADTPWWTVSHLDPRAGDIKDLWEPARFGWVYDLVRASLVTGEPRYAAAFGREFSGWVASSPPFRGPHWSCGQETAIRAIALLYAEANLALAPTDAAAVLRVLAASGERIADALGYAVSQRNNHAISEAVGLLALGARLRGVHPEAARWYARGRRWLARLVVEQFAADGWYAQHSFTYMRLALDQCVVAERVLRACGERLPGGAVQRLRAAAELLLAVVAPESGDVPNHGANDGAFVHPITTAEYRDFRAILTAACATWNVPLPCDVAADAEVLAWLGLDAPVAAEPLDDGVRSGASGWAAARVGPTQLFVRAGAYTTRPSHVDPLHVDVRFGSEPVVVDAGTFAYNAAPPWRNGLVTADVHNGPLLDGREPGVRGPRFLWYAWPDARIITTEWRDGVVTIVAERGRQVRRVVRVTARDVSVDDQVPSGVAAEVAVRWLLHPDVSDEALDVAPPRDTHAVASAATVVHAAEGAVDGWYSPAYGVRRASRTVVVRRDARDGVTIRTTIRSRHARTTAAASGATTASCDAGAAASPTTPERLTAASTAA